MDGFGQHLADDGHQRVDARRGNPACKAQRRDAGAVEHLADIDIAEARNDPLVEERGLDRGLAPLEAGGEVGFVEGIAERFWPDIGQQPMTIERVGGDQIHRAEAAGVVEGNARAGVGIKHHMVMFLGRGVGEGEAAGHVGHALCASCAGRGNQHAARHAQMNDQGLAGIEIGEDVFRPAAQPIDPCAGQAGGHVRGKWPAQIGAAHVCCDNPRTLQHGGKAATDCLDFWKFRQCGLSYALGGVVTPVQSPIRRGCTSGGQGPMSDQGDGTTHFGFQTVEEDAKAGMVHGVFTNVASRYDVMNDVMSMGIHRIWKDAMMDWLAPRDGQHLLDVAGGTGDVAFRFLKRAPGARATVLDMTESMLVAGQTRAEAAQEADKLEWVVGDAMALPFSDNSFDVYTISFGIRNVTRIADALAEAFRVLRPGGRLMVLEFSQLPNAAMQRAYDLYSFNVIPRMGQVIANDRDSYQYLVESIRKFPEQETFAEMIRTAGFEQVKYRNLSMGIAALHSGWKI